MDYLRSKSALVMGGLRKVEQNPQTIAVLREYEHAVTLGAVNMAYRIWAANPDLHDEFQAVEISLDIRGGTCLTH